MSIFIATVSLILGLHFLQSNSVILIPLIILYLLFVLTRFKWKKIALFISLFVLGALFSNIPRQYNAKNDEYIGVVVEVKQNYYLVQSHFEKFYVYEEDHRREIGDFLKLYSKPSNFEATTYESQFNFQQYLKNKGVKRQLTSNGLKEIFHQPIRIQNVKRNLTSHLSEDSAALVDALIFNTKDYNNDIINSANELNLIFLLSTSGIYFSFITRILYRLYFLKFNEKESHVLVLITVAPMAIFSFPKVGIARVIIGYLISLNERFKSKLSIIDRASISSFILLLINPYYAFEAGYLIGLGLTLSITFFQSLLRSYDTKALSKLVIPIFIYLMLLPYSSFSSGSFHLFSFPFQLILVPLNEIFIVISLLSLLRIPLYKVLDFYSIGLKWFYNGLSKIDLTIPIADFGPIYIAICYLFIFFIIYLLEGRRFRHVRNVAVAYGIILSWMFIPVRPLVENAVYFVNVGQGDSIIIQNHFHAVMIDTGGNKNFDMAEKSLIPFLKKHQIYTLDALIITHDDFDHSGASASLMKNYHVKQKLTKDSDFPYQVGDLTFFNLNHIEPSDKNDSSLVLYLKFMKKEFLFTGDASTKVESQILKEYPTLNCDILKVGHHGSKSSSSEEFIRQISPKEAVISVGKKNSYHHPDVEVIQLLEKYHVKIRRTDDEGTISYISYFT